VYTDVAVGLITTVGVKTEPGSQVYVLAPPAIRVMLFAAQAVGCEGVIVRLAEETTTFKVEVDAKPQLGDEIETVMVPAESPIEVLIEFVVDVPDHPPGKDQV